MLRGIQQQLPGDLVPSVGKGRDDGEYLGKHIISRGPRAVLQLRPVRAFELTKDLCAETGVGSRTIALSQRAKDRLAANVVRTALVAQQGTISADTRQVRFGVPSDCR